MLFIWKSSFTFLQKKLGKNNKEQYTLKIMKILRASSLGFNFTGSCKMYIMYKNQLELFAKKWLYFENLQHKV